jgi:hypothetical protein
MNLTINDTKDQRAYLDICEAQAIYGGSIAWWRKAVWQKRLTYHKRGARVVFSRADLNAYFAARRVQAHGEAA